MRILVDRLWPRGLSKHTAHIHHWLKDIAPSTSLRTWFHRHPEQWEEFQRRYHAELQQASESLARLRTWAQHGPLTLLYASRDTQHNNAVVVKAYLEQLISLDPTQPAGNPRTRKPSTSSTPGR
ncbi:MAG: DUF488 family protein [Nitrospirae bacterium]|nr:MAG: DUF488 family protein [Nitrospirota bacterium]